jgi:hypothetical protein
MYGYEHISCLWHYKIQYQKNESWVLKPPHVEKHLTQVESLC